MYLEKNLMISQHVLLVRILKMAPKIPKNFSYNMQKYVNSIFSSIYAVNIM